MSQPWNRAAIVPAPRKPDERLGEIGAANTFRTTYGIDGAVTLVGPWTDGPLNNDTGTVRLQRPDTPPPGDPTNFPQVTEDEVIYLNTAPWPENADGGGDSLNRTGLALFGNFASSCAIYAVCLPTGNSTPTIWSISKYTIQPGQRWHLPIGAFEVERITISMT